jgi:Raf kinase inhibitor-like YbhB/YbcL family protein
MKRVILPCFVPAVTAILLVATGCCKKSDTDDQPFKMQSSAFADNQRLADKYCYTDVSGGQNISLPFNWASPPEGTQSFALTIHDPEGGNWIHWAVFDIPATTDAIAEGASGHGMPYGCIELNNEFGTAGYGGPAPPAGSGTHRYIATLYALNTSSVGNISGFKPYAAINTLLAGKVISKATVTGTYSR